MTAWTLAEQVPVAVARALEGAAALTLAEIDARLPAHIREGRPSKRALVGAIKAAGWVARKGPDDIVVFRLAGAAGDPIAQHSQMGDNVAGEQLRLLIDRIERLTDEKKDLTADIADVFGEAKATGFDTKTMRAIVRLRAMEKHTRDEAEALIALYKTALGMA